MWTFTFAAVVDVKATRKKWNYLLTLLKRRWPKLAGLRVFELHKNHGLHVHLVSCLAPIWTIGLRPRSVFGMINTLRASGVGCSG